MLNFANEEKKRVLYYPQDIDELIKYFNLNNDATLIFDFDAYFDYSNQKDFFKNVKLIPFKKVLLIGNGSFDFNLENLKSNETLIELDDNYSEISYDFAGFPNLERLRYLYIAGSRNYASLSKLKELSLWSYPKKNIEEFLTMGNLQEIRFVQSKIQTLNGINHLKNLKSVYLIADKDLELDSDIPANGSVTELYIDGCKKINIDLIPRLFPDLTKLTIIKHEIKELRYLLDNLKSLRELNLLGSRILESDNRYWKNYPNIVSIEFLYQKNLLLQSNEFKK